jgi:AcrR family transcriptional regulator
MVATATRPAAGLRDRILAAAIGLLRDGGIKALSQPKVASAAGVPQGHLTYYFPRKADLLLAVARQTLEDTAREIQELLVNGVNEAPEDARARAVAIVTRLAQNRERTRMLLGLLVEADRDPKVRAQLVAGVAMVRTLVAFLFGRDPGDPDVDLILATLWGVGLRELLLGEGRSPQETQALIERITHLHALPGARKGELP